MTIDKMPVLLVWEGVIMTGEEIKNIIYAIGLIGWIPILAVFSGIAKVVSAFKGNYTGGDGINIDIKHNVDDNENDEEDE